MHCSGVILMNINLIIAHERKRFTEITKNIRFSIIVIANNLKMQNTLRKEKVKHIKIWAVDRIFNVKNIGMNFVFKKKKKKK